MKQSQSPDGFGEARDAKISTGIDSSRPGYMSDNTTGSDDVLGTMSAHMQDSEVINVIEEKIVIEKQHVETGKIKIRKTFTEETHSVSVPIVNDEYEIVRIDVPRKTLMAPPQAVRQEGDTTIISVIREITVVEKRYEVIEEIHVTRHKTELPLLHEISLRKEHVHIDRQTNDD